MLELNQETKLLIVDIRQKDGILTLEILMTSVLVRFQPHDITWRTSLLKIGSALAERVRQRWWVGFIPGCCAHACHAWP